LLALCHIGAWQSVSKLSYPDHRPMPEPSCGVAESPQLDAVHKRIAGVKSRLSSSDNKVPPPGRP